MLRPADQLSAQDLIFPSQREHRNYRLYRAIVFSQRRGMHAPVLLGAASPEEMDQLANRLLSEPDAVCGSNSLHCTIFPEACSVAIEMEVVSNGQRQSVLWGDKLWVLIGGNPRRVEVVRQIAGQSVHVNVDLSDPDATQAPLFPGDRVTWD
jgi:hypothetical protein